MICSLIYLQSGVIEIIKGVAPISESSSTPPSPHASRFRIDRGTNRSRTCATRSIGSSFGVIGILGESRRDFCI